MFSTSLLTAPIKQTFYDFSSNQIHVQPCPQAHRRTRRPRIRWPPRIRATYRRRMVRSRSAGCASPRWPLTASSSATRHPRIPALARPPALPRPSSVRCRRVGASAAATVSPASPSSSAISCHSTGSSKSANGSKIVEESSKIFVRRLVSVESSRGREVDDIKE